MKFKSFFATAAVAVSLILSSCGGSEAPAEANAENAGTAQEGSATGEQRLAIDPGASSVKWKGVMLGVKDHFGTIKIKDGYVLLNNGAVTGGEVTVDMNSINPTDANYSPKDGYTVEKLVQHLASPDFFDVANNPTATFTITGVNGAEANGNLTVRGKQNAEVIKNLQVTPGDNTNISGQLTFDRQKYGVSFLLPGKDMIISDEIVLDFSVAAHK
ncbi:MAG: YceI family protein [Flavobacteriales bacterium]|nr:YceI family protein [Flavobacteriales bacterium]